MLVRAWIKSSLSSSAAPSVSQDYGVEFGVEGMLCYLLSWLDTLIIPSASCENKFRIKQGHINICITTAGVWTVKKQVWWSPFFYNAMVQGRLIHV